MADRLFRAPWDEEEEEEEELEVGEEDGELPEFIDVDEDAAEAAPGEEGTKEAPLEIEDDRAVEDEAGLQPLPQQLRLDPQRYAQMATIFRPAEDAAAAAAARPRPPGAAPAPLVSALDVAAAAPPEDGRATLVTTGPVAVLPLPPRGLVRPQRPRMIRPSKSVMYGALKQVRGEMVQGLQDYPSVLLSSSFRVGWGPNGLLAMPSIVQQRTCLTDREALIRSGNADEEAEYSEACTVRVRKISVTMSTDLAYVREQYRPTLEVLRRHMAFAGGDGLLSPHTTVHHWQGTVEAGKVVRNSHQRAALTDLLKDHLRAAQTELECHRSHARRTMSGISLAHPFPLGAVHEVALRHMLDVWSLLLALWGDDHAKDEPLPMTSPGQARFCEQWRRRRQLDQWLKQTTGPRVDLDLRVAAAAPEPHTAAMLRVFLLLTGYRVSEAADVAVQAGDLRLAMLLSSLGSRDGPQPLQADLQAQMQAWREQGSHTLMNSALYNVYRLLGGDLTVLQDTLGDMFDWQRSLGCFLWYSYDNPAAGVEECVKEFLSRGAARLANPWPTCPPYIQELPLIREREDMEDGSTEEYLLLRMHANSRGHDDLTHLLLALHADPARATSGALLSPLTHTYCSMDYRFLAPIWLTLHSLGLAGALGGGYGSEQALICDWAAQLEAEGLWHEALFALLHLRPTPEYPKLREAALRAVLGRHAFRLQPTAVALFSRRVARREVRLPEWNQPFLTIELRIPVAWIDEADAEYHHARVWPREPPAAPDSAVVTVDDEDEEGPLPTDTLANYCEMLKLVERHLLTLSHAA